MQIVVSRLGLDGEFVHLLFRFSLVPVLIIIGKLRCGRQGKCEVVNGS
jgi:hypothetical protein